jgi:A/G-specific adenine glycosylase
MAQQTQVARVDGAWANFMSRFPTPRSLAEAPAADVLRAWAGLGYNRRAIQLGRAAARIEADHAGHVPRDVAALQRLPGIGPYTARAVAAIAFGAPVAAVDTNVRRTLERLLGRSMDPQELQVVADGLVARRDPASWSHASMELGATICRAGRPDCPVCPVRRWCATASRQRDTGPTEGILTRRPPSRPDSGASERPFERTSRWLRGRIVAGLRDLEDGAWGRLPEAMGGHGPEAIALAVEGLRRDGLLEEHPDGSVRLPSVAP